MKRRNLHSAEALGPTLVGPFFLALMLMSCLWLAGCKETPPEVKTVQDPARDEQVIREGIGESFAQVLSGTQDDQYLPHMLRGFSYSINDVTVDGQRASARLTVYAINPDAAVELAKERAKESEVASYLANTYNSSDEETRDQLVPYLEELVNICMDEQSEMEPHDLELLFYKNGDTWSLDPASLTTLVDTLV